MDPTSIRVLLGSSNQESYWIAKINSCTGNSVSITNNNSDIYIAGMGFGILAVYYSLIAKYDANGNIQWQRGITSTTPRENAAGKSIALDSLNNIYYAGIIQNSDTRTLITKYNESGIVQWQKTLALSSNQSTITRFLTIDLLDNIYICGDTYNGINDLIFIAKYNTSGVLQWSRSIYGTIQVGGPADGRTLGNTGYSLAVDSLNNPHIVSRIGNDGDILIIKYNASGVIQSQRTLTSSDSVSLSNASISIDSLDNVYISGMSRYRLPNNTLAYGFLIAKYDSFGSLQWQKVIGFFEAPIASPTPISLTIDRLDNIYLCGTIFLSNNDTDRDILIMKLDSLGNIQWQGKFGSEGRQEGNSIKSDDLYNIYICGTDYSSPSSAIIAKLPSDGPVIGTYGEFTFSQTFLSVQSGYTVIDSLSSFTETSGPSTTSTSTEVESSTNFVSSTTSICV